MAYEQDRTAFSNCGYHLLKAFRPKRPIAYSEHLVYKKNLGLQVNSNRKSKARTHTGGVMLERRADEIFQRSKGDDLVEVAVNLALLPGCYSNESELVRKTARARVHRRRRPDKECHPKGLSPAVQKPKVKTTIVKKGCKMVQPAPNKVCLYRTLKFRQTKTYNKSLYFHNSDNPAKTPVPEGRIKVTLPQLALGALVVPRNTCSAISLISLGGHYRQHISANICKGGCKLMAKSCT